MLAAASLDQVKTKPKSDYSTFESLTLWLTILSQKSEKLVLLVVVYRPPSGAYLEFLSEFSDFLSSLVLSSDKVVIGQGCSDVFIMGATYTMIKSK